MSLTRCRRLGITSFPAENFKPGPGGKDCISWSEANGTFAFHARQEQYYRLAESSELNDLCATVDEIADQLRSMVSTLEASLSEKLTESNNRIGLLEASVTERFASVKESFEERDRFIEAHVEEVSRTSAEERARITALEDSLGLATQSISELEAFVKASFATSNEDINTMRQRLDEGDQRIIGLEAFTNQLVNDLAEKLTSQMEIRSEKSDAKHKAVAQMVGAKADSAYVRSALDGLFQDVHGRLEWTKQRHEDIHQQMELFRRQFAQWERQVEELEIAVEQGCEAKRNVLKYGAFKPPKAGQRDKIGNTEEPHADGRNAGRHGAPPSPADSPYTGDSRPGRNQSARSRPPRHEVEAQEGGYGLCASVSLPDIRSGHAPRMKSVT